jgi:cytochrome c556
MMQRLGDLVRPVLWGSLVCAIGVAVVAGAPLRAQVAAKPDPSNTAVTRTDDFVLGRQMLMNLNETAMMPIDRLAGGQDVDLGLVKAQAFIISSVLSAAPHMFPSSTKPVFDKDGAPTPSTAASPKIWDDFDAFYETMSDVSNLAYDLSQAADAAKAKTLAMQLRTACDSCHENFMQVYDPTKAPSP